MITCMYVVPYLPILTFKATVTAGIERICGRTFTASTSGPANQLPTAYASSGTNSICSMLTTYIQ